MQATLPTETVEITFLRDPLWRLPPYRVPVVHLRDDDIEDEDDETFWSEMMEKSASELVVDYILFPLFGLAAASFFVFAIVASAWASVNLALLTYALID